ncbi:MAG: 50S ribosomal protein L22 [Candidatus Altimarinota bacterium]
MKSSIRNARISPKKLNLVAGMIRGEKAQDALNQLRFTPKKGAKILHKLITSAVANAKNNYDQNEDNLFIKSVMVTKGITYKRGLPVSRGRYHPILKRNTNIIIEVGMIDPTAGKAKKSTAKAEKTSKEMTATESTPEKPKTKSAPKAEAKAAAPKKKPSTKKKSDNA